MGQTVVSCIVALLRLMWPTAFSFIDNGSIKYDFMGKQL
jgi:hypothetical protein